MKTTTNILIGILFFMGTSMSFAQSIKFRSGIFLHHSTGGRIWGLNQTSMTSVPQEISTYNTAQCLIGDNAVSLEERLWPIVPGNNEWSTWHAIFEDTNPLYDKISTILQNNKIVVIKSCFPSSQITGIGSPADTLNPTKKTIFNYKWHWRSIIRVMRLHPENFFVIWTNAPLVSGQTDDSQAQHADDFCRWAKDTLAQGLDTEFGAFPKNIYVFDFFHKLAGADGKLPLQYADAADNSHPNEAATNMVAPQFVQEIFDAAINYESGSCSQLITIDKPWNMVAVSVVPSTFDANTLFPGKTGTMFAFNTTTQSYSATSTLAIGQGYWALYTTSGRNTITGSAVSGTSVTAAKAGWVLLGSMSNPVEVSALIVVPAGAITGSIYRFNPVTQDYISTTVINPGEAVWVKVNQPCTITFP